MRLLMSFFLLALTSSGFCQQTIQKMIDAAQKHDTIIVKEMCIKSMT